MGQSKVLSITGLVIASVLMLAGCVSTAEPDHAQEAVVEEPAPVETEDPGVEAPALGEYEIPAELSAEELGKVIFEDRITQWYNAGAKDSLIDDLVDKNLTWDEYLPQLAKERANVFANALVGEGYLNNPNLALFVERGEEANLAVLRSYVATQWNTENPENIEGYRVWIEVNAVEELTDDNAANGERSIKVDLSLKSNADKNTVDEPTILSNSTLKVAVIEQDGRALITNYDS